jgi:hypothetical protein
MEFHTASRIATFLAFAATSVPSLAATSAVTPSGYLVTHTAELAATPAAAYSALAEIGKWWNGSHTYSGVAGNLALDLRAGGCFCETWGEGNSIEHARVIYAAPGKALRMEGGLGPLQDMAVAAIMNFAFATAEGKTVLTFTYRVRGADGNLDKTAAIVDKVLGEQVTRFAEYLSKK